MSDLIVEENVALAPKTTFKIGGPARYFTTVRNIEQLKEALMLARDHSWPVFILADGSNLIVSDAGFAGLVVKLEIGSLKLGIDSYRLEAGSAVSMAQLVDESINAGLSGLEWAGGLPGSFGGAIRGNAGAFGSEIKDSIESVTSVEMATGREIRRGNIECQFAYRDSIFKRVKEVIVSATLALSPGDRNALRQEADDHFRYRQEKHPLEYPNAGSIFKNVPLEKIPKDYLPMFAEAIKNDPFPIVPTAKIIAVAGLKGLRVGNAQVSEKHSNYMVNLGEAKAADLVILIEKVKSEIRSKYQVELEVEPELVGF